MLRPAAEHACAGGRAAKGIPPGKRQEDAMTTKTYESTELPDTAGTFVPLDALEPAVLLPFGAGHAANRSTSPALSAGDLDARWDEAESSGEETAGGSQPTPDQEVVEEIGRAIGVTYQEGEVLKVGEKEAERDRHRWELDPASSEDYQERLNDTGDGDADEILTMTHAGHLPRKGHR
jgi:hypothetical protein